jgi:hypothetical protein
MGNNRYEAVISNQIEIMIIAAMEPIARTEAENVEQDKNDMQIYIHKQPKHSQVAELAATSVREHISPR